MNDNKFWGDAEDGNAIIRCLEMSEESPKQDEKSMSWLDSSSGGALVNPPAQHLDKGIGNTIQSAGRWLAQKWAYYEGKGQVQSTALTMAIAAMGAFPLPGTITEIVAVAEKIRGLHGFADQKGIVGRKSINPPKLSFKRFLDSHVKSSHEGEPCKQGWTASHTGCIPAEGGTGTKPNKKEVEEETEEPEEVEPPDISDVDSHISRVRGSDDRVKRFSIWTQDDFGEGLRNYESDCTVYTEEGEYTDEDDNTFTAYRYFVRDDSGETLSRGEWTWDKDEAEQQGIDYADENRNEEDDLPEIEEDEPEEEDESDEEDSEELDEIEEEEPAPAVLPKKIKYGKSEAEILLTKSLDDDEVEAMAGKLFEGSDDWEVDLASALGAPDDAKVIVKSVGKYVKKYSDDSACPNCVGIRVEIQHPKLDNVSRFVGIDGNGKKFIRNEILEVKEQYQKEGLGLSIFSRQVENATESGFAYIGTHAAGGFGQSMNGYYTWPVFGYNQSLNALAKHDKEKAAKIRERFPEAKSIRDVMRATSIAGLTDQVKAGLQKRLDELDEKLGRPKRVRETFTGAEWWQCWGTDLHEAKFDLAENSWSQYILAQYMEKKAAQKANKSLMNYESKSMPNDPKQDDKRGDQINLNEQEMKAAEKAWDTIRKLSKEETPKVPPSPFRK